ncbi:MAG: Na/Pi cotransporter family protein [Oscillospiraceae bacterium]|nr:Na/Pi cotransporter family protein [Oscillospiraceae bacterium]
MSFFELIMLLGGVALFLFGMNTMSEGLEKSAGGRLEIILQSATANLFRAFMLGVGVTTLIQSSSAMTVMLVGLVNSGIMQLEQTVGVIIGSNVGTTITAWVISLTGLTGGSFIVQILKPDNFAHLFAILGISFAIFSKKEKKRNAGDILLGFAVLMAGIALMRDAVSGLEDNEQFRNLMVAFQNPVFGLFIGTVITCIIQSSLASLVILQAVAMTIPLTYATVIPIIMGLKIGTCITATLASIGANKNAKRVAAVHVYFNVVGAVVVLVAIHGTNLFYELPFLSRIVNPMNLAMLHSLFAVITSVILFPFTKQLVSLARFTIRDKPGEETLYDVLDERLLATPAVAIAHCHNLVVDMSNTAKEAVFSAFSMMVEYDEDIAIKIREYEDILDKNEDTLNTYLVKIAAQRLNDADSRKVSELLHAIGDLERIGDHAVNILESAEEMRDKKLTFSLQAMADLAVAHSALMDIINLTFLAFDQDDADLARQVEPLEQVVDMLIHQMRSRHITRLQRGECSIIPGFIWTDLLVNYERVSDHCSNIAVCVLQINNVAKGRHDYLSVTRTPDNIEFSTLYDLFNKKYILVSDEETHLHSR